jgi:hypothetical protein
MGVLAASGRLGAVSAQFVNGSLEENIPLLLFVTSACTVVGGLIAWLLPHDTTGSAMAEVEGEVGLDGSTKRGSAENEVIQSVISPLENRSTDV